MSDDPTLPVTRARAALDRAEKRVEERRDELHARIVEALRAGVKQAELVRISGYTREHLRQIRKAADDAEASRPPAKS